MNRLDESLKFIEDVIRFNFEHTALLRKVRALRNGFLKVKKTLRDQRIIAFRRSSQDLGRDPGFDTCERSTDEDLMLANLTRAQESARTLEEIMKREHGALSRRCKRIRFALYDIGSSVSALLARRFDPRIYVILDEQYLNRKDIGTVVGTLEKLGATMFQLRIRTLPDRVFYQYGIAVKRSLKSTRIKFIVNNRVDIALACRADGVHLGQDDMPVHIARRMLGSDMIIGASARTLVQARKAEHEGADYLGVGALFRTETKPDALGTSLRTLRTICRQVGVPVVGIGGITGDNYRRVLGAGAAGIAVASYVLRGNARRAMRSLTGK